MGLLYFKKWNFKAQAQKKKKEIAPTPPPPPQKKILIFQEMELYCTPQKKLNKTFLNFLVPILYS